MASLDGTVEGLDATQVVDEIGKSLSSYKLPRQLLFVAEVPRAPNGKADYPAAREMFASLT